MIGVPDAYRGEAAKAFVTLRDGAEPLHARRACGPSWPTRSASTRCRRALEFRASLPRTPVGKLSRAESAQGSRRFALPISLVVNCPQQHRKRPWTCASPTGRLAFRDEVRAFFAAKLPDAIRDRIASRRITRRKDDLVTWQRILQRQGLGRAALAGGMGRHRLDAGPALHLPARRCSAAPAPQPLRLRRQHGRAGDLHLRHRGAEAALPAAHRQSRRLVVPGLLGARRRLRPRLA